MKSSEVQVHVTKMEQHISKARFGVRLNRDFDIYVDFLALS